MMKTVSRARVLADRRTIFNLAAPLSNPAMPAFQVVGTPMQTNAQLLAEILQRLGRTRSFVVTGEPGIDEVSISCATQILDVSQQDVSSMRISPQDLVSSQSNTRRSPEETPKRTK